MRVQYESKFVLLWSSLMDFHTWFPSADVISQKGKNALTEFNERHSKYHTHSRGLEERINFSSFFFLTWSTNQYDQSDSLRKDVWPQALEREKGSGDYNSWVGRSSGPHNGMHWCHAIVMPFERQFVCVWQLKQMGNWFSKQPFSKWHSQVVGGCWRSTVWKPFSL